MAAQPRPRTRPGTARRAALRRPPSARARAPAARHARPRPAARRAPAARASRAAAAAPAAARRRSPRSPSSTGCSRAAPGSCVLGVLLAGIVFANVALLELNAGIARTTDEGRRR